MGERNRAFHKHADGIQVANSYQADRQQFVCSYLSCRASSTSLRELACLRPHVIDQC